MYGVVTRYRLRAPLAPEIWQQAEAEVVNVITGFPGFRAYYALAICDTEMFAVHFWDTADDADASLNRMLPVIRRILGEDVVATATRHRGEVMLFRER